MPNALDGMYHRHEDAHLDHGACRGRATQHHHHHHHHYCCYHHHHCHYCYHYCCYRGYRGRAALGGRHAPHGCWHGWWCIDEPHEWTGDVAAAAAWAEEGVELREETAGGRVALNLTLGGSRRTLALTLAPALARALT